MLSKSRLKNIKLVLFDLDGTLLNDRGEIGEESISLIKQLEQLGVHFSFASGRLHSALTEYATELNITAPIISLDGSYLKSYPEGKLLFQSVIPRRKVKQAIEFADQFLLKIALCHADAVYFTEHNSVIPDIIDKFGAKFEEVHSYDNYLDETLEIVFASDMKDNLKFVQSRLKFPHSFGLTSNYYKSHLRESIYYLDVRKSGSTKATGLKYLLKHLGLRISDAAVLGDWYNDSTLFETEALKIAVANAVPEIKFKADYELKRSNNEDGTAEFLEMVLKAKKS
ncbi:MAG: HAD family hydrolase [Ignavibacteria bacterium]|nr:HAD family hydrolase [Ignavibacteria bacterium]